MDGKSSREEVVKKREKYDTGRTKEDCEWKGEKETEMWLRAVFPAVILLSIEAESNEL